MGASKDKFSANVIYGDDGTKKIYYLAKALTEYRQNPQQSDPTVDDPHFCELFFVDKVKHINDTAGGDCLQSYIEVGSDNAAHHSSLRHSLIAGCVKVNDVVHYYIQLNDGGLNTLAHAELINILGAYENFVKISCNLKSAYYLLTNYFRLEFYVADAQGNFPSSPTHTEDLIVSNGTDPRNLPAKTVKSNFVEYWKNIYLGNNVVGRTLKLKIYAVNDEGTYTKYQNEKTAIIKKAMTYVEVYRRSPSGKGQPNWADHNMNPTDPSNYDERYAFYLEENLYDYNELSPAQGGLLGQVFHTSMDSYINTGGERLKGVLLHAGETVEDAYGAEPSDLPDGYFYGVPYPNYDSTGKAWVIPSNSGARLGWHTDVYVPQNFSIVLTLSGVHDSLTNTYTFTLRAALSGSWSGSVQITSKIYPDELNNTTLLANVQGSGSSASFTVGTFTLTPAQVASYVGIRTGCLITVGQQIVVSDPSTSSPTPAQGITEASMSMQEIREGGQY